LDAIEAFYPNRMASRILGMGDVVTLVEKAQEAITQEEAIKLEEKLQKEAFTFEDFRVQLQQLKKMGSLDSIVNLIPGVGGALRGISVDDKSLTRIEAIINSMTEEERSKPQIMDGSRRKRIAQGSGTDIQEVNRLIKQFFMMQKMVKDFHKMDLKKLKGIFKF
jgi:signal recognition particle subunit SRP54